MWTPASSCSSAAVCEGLSWNASAAQVVVDSEVVVAARPLLPSRLEVRDKDGTYRDVAHGLERSYISDDLAPLYELAAATGAPLPAAPTLPCVTVQGVKLSFDKHAWSAEQRRAGLLDLHVARDAVEIQRAHRRQHRERLVRRRHRGARRSRTARLQSHERALFFPSSRVRVGLKHAQSLKV